MPIAERIWFGAVRVELNHWLGGRHRGRRLRATQNGSVAKRRPKPKRTAKRHGRLVHQRHEGVRGAPQQVRRNAAEVEPRLLEGFALGHFVVVFFLFRVKVVVAKVVRSVALEAVVFFIFVVTEASNGAALGEGVRAHCCPPCGTTFPHLVVRQ
jgi:hypothetical protein